MKALINSAAVIAVVVGGVFGLTFLNQNARKPPVAGPGPTVIPDSGPPLYIPVKQAVWDPDDLPYAAEFEKGTRDHHYDFWVSNRHPKPVKVQVLNKSCVCTEVLLGQVPAAEWADWQRRLAALDLASNAVGGPNLAAPLALLPVVPKVQWLPMVPRNFDTGAPPLVVPPATAEAGPQVAIIRLTWEAKEVKPLRLTANVEHGLDSGSEVTPFEVPTVTVAPVMLSHPQIQLPDMGYNDTREASFVCWSATRPHFGLTVEEASHDPCVEVLPPQPLNAQELKTLPGILRQSGAAGPTRMLCGYLVRALVHEHRGGRQLDLGPLARKLEVKTDTGFDTSVMLHGMVRGAVRVGDGTDTDRVNLGTFRSDRPHEKVVIVSCPDPNVQLRLKSAPDFLAVTLDPMPGGGLRQWKLRAEVEAHKVSGYLPPDSAVYLEIVADPPRAIRIPVVGNATGR